MAEKHAATYVPTTDDVRDQYQASIEEYGTRDGLALDAEEASAEFDRWLAEHDAQVAAQALRDAAAGAPSALGITSGSRIEVGVRAATWLRACADRIAGGEQP